MSTPEKGGRPVHASRRGSVVLQDPPTDHTPSSDHMADHNDVPPTNRSLDSVDASTGKGGRRGSTIEKFQRQMTSLRKSSTVDPHFPVKYPFWLESEAKDGNTLPIDEKAVRNILEDMKQKVKNKKPSQRYKFIHDENQRLQLKQKGWTMINNIIKIGVENAEASKDVTLDDMTDEEAAIQKRQAMMEEAKKRLQDAEEEFIAFVGQPTPTGTAYGGPPFYALEHPAQVADPFAYAFAYGPAGDLPMHTCFLLGLHDLGKRVIEKYYTTKELISLPYVDDTKSWSGMQPVVLDMEKDNKNIYYHDGGLFTGETVLHIAIVQQKDELVKWLLERGANVVARATGAFFKHAQITKRSEINSSASSREGPTSNGMDFGFVQYLFDYVKKQKRPLLDFIQNTQNSTKLVRINNTVSACDYGELPLSFAASVGNLEICEALLEHVVQDKYRLKHDKVWKDFKQDSKRTLESQGIEFEGKSSLQQAKSDLKVWNELRFDIGATVEVQHSHVQHNHMQHHHMHHSHIMHTTEDHVDKDLKHKEVMEGRAKKARFYFMNACVLNDSNEGTGFQGGNTALHMAVYHRQIHIINWLMENGAAESLRVMNDFYYTPFTLAARHGFVDIFYLFLNKHMRDVKWAYGEVQMSRVSLEQLDSFRIHKLPLHDKSPGKWRSAIEIIVENEVDAFANDSIFNKLIVDKWNKFARQMYLRRTFGPYLLLHAIFCSYMFLRCSELNRTWTNYVHTGTAFVSGGQEEAMFRTFREGTPSSKDWIELASFLMQIILVAVGCPWLISKGWKQRRLRVQDLDPQRDGSWNFHSFGFKNLQFALDWLSAFMIWTTFFLRVGRNYESELDLMAVTSILMWTNLLNLIMPFKFFGIMAITTYNMLVGDVFRFVMVFVITTMAFALAMTSLYQKSDDPDNLQGMDIPGSSILRLIWVANGEVATFRLITKSRNYGLTLAVHFVYIILQTILMLNLLIAMMTKTFMLSMDDTHKTWIFPFANLVLRYEKYMDESYRNLPQNRCGEADRADTASMTAEETKEAKFYIVEVGKDEREEKRKQIEKEQVKRHVSTIDRLTSSLKKSEEILNEELIEWRDNSLGRGQVVTTGGVKSKVLEEQVVRLEKLLEGLQASAAAKSFSPVRPGMLGSGTSSLIPLPCLTTPRNAD